MSLLNNRRLRYSFFIYSLKGISLAESTWAFIIIIIISLYEMYRSANIYFYVS